MTANVFLSYAEEDALPARRLYQTLKRSDVDVWGYKEDGRVAANFRDEFEERIRTARYFCLLDGPPARRSPWIRHECSVARAASTIMVVCLLAKYSEADSWAQEELFDDQNLTRAIDLTNWDSGVQELCRFLQIVDRPGWGVPRDRDFEREVFDSGLDVARVQELINLYRDFRERSGDSESSEYLLRVVISKSRLYGAVNVVSPRLALGVMQADAGRHEDALKTFSGLTESHALDPRGWAGLAGAHFNHGRYDDCLRCLRKARELAETHYRNESADRLAELVHNIAAVQLVVGMDDEAWRTLSELGTEQQEQPFIRALRGKLLLRRQQYEDALAELGAAWSARTEASPTLAVDLADCHRALGRHADEAVVLDEAVRQFPEVPEIHKRAADCHLARSRTASAIESMQKATGCSPEHTSASPQYRAQLAALLCKTGRVEEGVTEARRCVEEAALTKPDRYYRGLAYYLLGEIACAEYELAQSRLDPVVRGWPDYEALTEGTSRPRRWTDLRRKWQGKR